MKSAPNRRDSKLLAVGRRITPSRFTVLSALLIGISFIVPGAGALMLIALAPFLFQITRVESLSSCLREAIWLALIGNAIVLHFAYQALQSSFHSGPIVTLYLSLLFFAFNEFQFYAIAVAAWWTKRRWPQSLWTLNFALAAFYVVIDLIVPKLFADTLGFALFDQFYLRQISDIGGAHLLTFLIILTSLFFADAIRWRKWRYLIPPIVLCLAGSTYGAIRSSQIEEALRQEPRVVKFGVVQSNISEELKAKAFVSDLGSQQQMVDRQLTLTHELLKSHPETQIVVWAEGAYPFPFRGSYGAEYNKMDQSLIELVESSKKQLLFGGISTNKKNGRLYNSIQSLSPSGDLQTYRKIILVPFGEYTPGVELLHSLSPSFKSEYESGDSLKTLDVILENGIVSLVPVICYEALFPSHAARGARQGGQVIVDVADDTSFRSSVEARLHLRAAAFTSIATRLPQVRATNSGYSAWIDSLGTIHEPSVLNAVEAAFYSVPVSHLGPSVFTKFSQSMTELWSVIFLIFGVASLLEALRRVR